MSNQAQLAEESLHSSILLAEKYSANRTIGIAHLNLARLYTLRGELFEAFRMLQNARQHFKIAQCENEEMIALQHEADIYRQLKMPRHTREASIQAAHSFGEKKLVVDCVEAYITAIDIALSEKRSRLARQYLDTCSPMLAEAPRNLSALWKCYNAHPLLLRTKQQRLKAIQIIQESATELEEVGNLQYALTVRLFGTQLAAKLRQKDVTEQYQASNARRKVRELCDVRQISWYRPAR